VFDNPRKVFKDAQDLKIMPHYLFRLGPPIGARTDMKNGPSVRQSARVWCMLDLLLTSATITDALRETKRRLGAGAADLDEDEDRN
jgi:hypothetical protein